MTLSEFKAWFEGFTEGIDGAPSAKQFEKIKAEVNEISGTPITYPIYIDRWVNPYRPYWDRYRATLGGTTGGATWTALQAVGRNDGVGQANFATYSYIDPASKGDNQTVAFDSHAAMYELGKMEATH